MCLWKCCKVAKIAQKFFPKNLTISFCLKQKRNPQIFKQNCRSMLTHSETCNNEKYGKGKSKLTSYYESTILNEHEIKQNEKD